METCQDGDWETAALPDCLAQDNDLNISRRCITLGFKRLFEVTRWQRRSAVVSEGDDVWKLKEEY